MTFRSASHTPLADHRPGQGAPEDGAQMCRGKDKTALGAAADYEKWKKKNKIK